MDIQYLTKISNILREGVSTGLDVFDFANSFSQTQLESKTWLVEALSKQNYKRSPIILILGGWYGSYLVPLLNEYINPSHIHFNDIDEQCLNVATQLHTQKNISFHHFDATTNYIHFNADIVINTSCEHMMWYKEMLKEGPNTLFVLQSCDEEKDPGHVNVSHSTDDFVSKLGLNRVFFRARKSLGRKNRFMVIGKP